MSDSLSLEAVLNNPLRNPSHNPRPSPDKPCMFVALLMHFFKTGMLLGCLFYRTGHVYSCRTYPERFPRAS